MITYDDGILRWQDDIGMGTNKPEPKPEPETRHPIPLRAKIRDALYDLDMWSGA